METSGYVKASPGGGLFFGWRVALALFLATFALFGVSIYSFVTMTVPLSEVYGWTPAEAGSLVSAMWLSAPLSLFLGPVIARVGAWRLLMFGFLLQAIVMALLPLISEIWQAYALRVLMGLGKICMVVPMPVLISRWFSRRFATAMAVVWAGGSAGGMVLAPLTEYLSSHYGWQAASLIIAAGIVGTMLLAALLVRGASYPADLGIGKDGDPISPEAPSDAAAHSSKHDLKTVLASVNWLTAAIMSLAVIGAGIAGIALISQEPVIMADVGISAAEAAAVLGLIGAAAMVGSLLTGWLLDRLPAAVPALIIGAAMFGGLGAMYFLPYNPNILIAAFGAVAVGYAMGGGELLWMDLTKRQFGEAAYATTYGGWYLSLQIGYAAGGGIAGLTFSNFGTVGFLAFVAAIYLPAALFSVWRPGMRQ